MENSIPIQIPFPQPSAEPSAHLTTVIHIHPAMATNPPQLIKASLTLYIDYDIIFSCIKAVNKGMLLQQSVFSFISSKDVLSE